ncbi:endonuclease/exonuclease/phosphatase family protein [Lutimonas sp.]|uniref:endonuclease/exonuclease/phosphatase family protein n=1 Tax=Lutimonas sp. TaxID=1872403 RepID=UPI003D9B3903
MRTFHILLFSLALIPLFCYVGIEKPPSKKTIIKTIGFYNVENLFDTVDDSLTIDEDYTPAGKNHFTITQYKKKIHNTARVLLELGGKNNEFGPAIIGLAEIENYSVVHDLVNDVRLVNSSYQIIHKDSPDRRGIDVALIYRDSEFFPLDFKFIEVKLWDDSGRRIYTRDILYVKGVLENEELHLIVNHWPSRRGGKSRSESKRMKTAFLVRQITDDILLRNPEAKILILGDFNDNPSDKSIKKSLLKPIQLENQLFYPFFNPMDVMFRKGWNSLAYRDELFLFDQIILSSIFKKKKNKAFAGFQFYRAGIFNPDYLITPNGPYKGYPMRSFQNNHFADGYSDHYPVYVKLIKSVKE